jgi:restriction system protein
MKEHSKSKQIAIKTIFEMFRILKANNGEMRGKQVIEEITKNISFNEYENQILEKTGNVRWRSVFHFYTIDCIKAGFIRKQKGVWYLTPEGEAAIKLGAEKLLDTATAKYREWNASRIKTDAKANDDDNEIEEAAPQQQKALLDQYEEQALEGLRDFIVAMGPYDFQDLVAKLLSAMGYHISDVATKGRDGGIDIIAYTDPLGVVKPRIIVQVKHRPEAQVASDDIQRLAGTMKRSSDVGIFVTSGGFSTPAKNEARSSDKHIELIDFERFIELWQLYYDKMKDEDKNMLPLHPIYFLGSNE